MISMIDDDDLSHQQRNTMEFGQTPPRKTNETRTVGLLYPRSRTRVMQPFFVSHLVLAMNDSIEARKSVEICGDITPQWTVGS